MKTYHLLNGDALKSQLIPLNDQKIVIRECLVEGNVKGESLEAFFNNRMAFFKETYKINEPEYIQKAKVEILKITAIEPHSTINLWFENDLFCQTNFWFAVNVLSKLGNDYNLFLVSPLGKSWKGFGGMNYEALSKAYEQKKVLGKKEQTLISELWIAYRNSNWEVLRKNASQLNTFIDCIEEVVEAHIERFTKQRPQQSLRKIINELHNPSFGNVFKVFFEREGIYGFGDMQVKRIMEKMEK